ncbi:hypothetical protein VAE122_630001 [Vibrio aestuarianus]|nr:hypothetical protein VAE122_630001 [Vibrio aestuarianus]
MITSIVYLTFVGLEFKQYGSYLHNFELFFDIQLASYYDTF